jgi:L-rhamnose-H+ transport protein
MENRGFARSRRRAVRPGSAAEGPARIWRRNGWQKNFQTKSNPFHTFPTLPTGHARTTGTQFNHHDRQTLVPPLVHGQIHEILSRVGSRWVLGGVLTGAAGIALCGAAGHFKERDLDAGHGLRGGFSLAKGLMLSFLASVLSAAYGFALDASIPIVDVAEQYGAGIWKGNVAYLFANSGAFVTSLVFCGYLMWKNKSSREFTHLRSDQTGGSLPANYLLAFLTGTLWYGQFFFYNLGHVRLGQSYAFSSWAIHMIILVLISNLVAVIFKEWKGCRGATKTVIGFGLVVLCAAVLLLTYGNYLGSLPKNKRAHL